MKYLITLISLLIFNFLGCSDQNSKPFQINSKPFQILEYYDMNGNSINLKDTLFLNNLTEQVQSLKLLSRNKIVNFKIKKDTNSLYIYFKNSSGIIYDKNNFCILKSYDYNNINGLNSPYFIINSHYLGQKKFLINNKEYKVSLYITNTSNRCEDPCCYAYYNIDFGFILYIINVDKYLKINNLINYPDGEELVCKDLIKSVMKDSSFFIYNGHLPPPPLND